MKYLVKSISRKLFNVINNPNLLGIRLITKISPFLSDKIYLKLLFPLKVGYALDLENPITYNQKLQWLKLNYRKPIMTTLVDKYEMKQYLKNIIGEDYLVENYGVWDTFKEINFDKLPERFVLKTTHDSGGVILVKNKRTFDIKSAEKKFTARLKKNAFFLGREWPYKNVKPRIIAEAFLDGNSNGDLYDYKVFCFDGKVKALFVATERQSGNEVKFNFFDQKFNSLNIVQFHPVSKRAIEKPENFDKMIELSEKISAGFPHLRVDFYNISGKIYIGELTFYHHGGVVPFKPEFWDNEFGSWINLPQKD